jgi:DNA (cytosine-5)-methyltransferase 1
MYRFMTLVRRTMPDIVSMENVPDLADTTKYPVFGEFVETLRALDYKVYFKKIDASKYGVPQRRHRLVLLASRFGDISMIAETHSSENLVTVRKAIGSLPRLRSGMVDSNDPLHRASKLSDLNMERIAATPRNGGSATSWPKALVPKCYRRRTGRSYMVSVYGRMRWNSPASTVTTQFMTLGTGRYGHPSQNRAISMREAARFQTFPDYYKFAPGNLVIAKNTARHIGNAVPVLLGRAIGKSIKKHLRRHLQRP